MSGITRRARRACFAGLVAVTMLSAVPGAAHAAVTQDSVFQDDNLLLYRGDDVSDATMRELHSLGVTRVRLTVPWRAFAPGHRARHRPKRFTHPADPAQYDPVVFDLHDHVLRVAQRLGVKVLFNVTGGAPLWATGLRNGRRVGLQWRPDAKAFGQFVRMLGTRYDGTHKDENQGNLPIPRVDAWSLWNEPNQGAALQPQWVSKDGRFVAAAPRIYRDLARSAITALRATGHGQDTILLGETAPRGVDRFDATASMRPVPFLADVLCLDPVTLGPLEGRAGREQGCNRKANRRKLLVSGYGHHPYSIVSSPATPDANPDDITLADAPRLGRLLDAGAALGRLPAHLRYWWTEYGWQTKPPDPIRGVDPQLQARWLGEAEQQTRTDGRVAALTQFLLLDDLPRDEPGASLKRKWGTYQTGLEWSDGTRKPAYDAYRLPFVLGAGVRAGATGTAWAFVRPVAAGISAPTTAQLQLAAPGSDAFQDVGDPVPVPSDGIVTLPLGVVQGGSYRFRWSPPPGPAPQRTGLQSLFGGGGKPAPPPVYISMALTVPGA